MPDFRTRAPLPWQRWEINGRNTRFDEEEINRDLEEKYTV